MAPYWRICYSTDRRQAYSFDLNGDASWKLSVVASPRNHRYSRRISSRSPFPLLGAACEHGEIAVQLGPQLADNGRQHDAVNEAAHDLGGFGHGFGGVERLGEAPDLATIELGEVGMELQHRRTLAGAKRVSVCAFSCSSAV